MNSYRDPISRLLGSLPRHAIYPMIQTVIGIITLFISYRVLVSNEGLEKVGLWSILTAGSALARFADVSGSGVLTRFVARENYPKGRVREYIHTVILTSICVNGSICFLAYYLSPFFLQKLTEPDYTRYLEVATSIIPFVIVNTIFLPPIVSALSSSLDGLNRINLRAIVVSISSVIMLILVIFLVPVGGIEGYVLALLLQNILLVVSFWFCLRSEVSDLGVFPSIWSAEAFRATFKFGLKLQSISVFNLATEPLAKFLVANTGGLSSVAVYDLALKVVIQTKGILASAFQSLVAATAMHKTESAKLSQIGSSALESSL